MLGQNLQISDDIIEFKAYAGQKNGFINDYKKEDLNVRKEAWRNVISFFKYHFKKRVGCMQNTL